MTGHEEAVRAAGANYRAARDAAETARRDADKAQAALIEAYDRWVDYERRMPS